MLGFIGEIIFLVCFFKFLGWCLKQKGRLPYLYGSDNLGREVEICGVGVAYQ